MYYENCRLCEVGIATPGTVYRDSNEAEYMAQEMQCGLLVGNPLEACNGRYRVHLEGPCLLKDDFCIGQEHCKPNPSTPPNTTLGENRKGERR